jgi:hypothetical protein
MPLADQAGAVARPLQQRRQGRMLGRQADLGVAPTTAPRAPAAADTGSGR